MAVMEFIEEKEYSKRLDKLRHDAVETSFYKYGSARTNFKRGYVNALESHDRCIEAYRRTGNLDYIVDAMNYLMFEFMYPQKEGAFYRHTQSEESAGISGISVKEMEDIKNNG